MWNISKLFFKCKISLIFFQISSLLFTACSSSTLAAKENDSITPIKPIDIAYNKDRNSAHTSNYVDKEFDKVDFTYLPEDIKNRPLINKAKPYPANLQKNFKDLFERHEINGNYLINQAPINIKTPRVQYNVKNGVFTTTASGVSFNNWDVKANVPEEYDTPVALNSEGTVPNDTYRKILRYSVSLNFINELENKTQPIVKFSTDLGDLKIGDNGGTGWILDYKLPSKNETYPLTWFYATNLHVIRALSSKQSYDPYKYNPKTNIITSALQLRYYPIGEGEYNNALGKVGSGASLANSNASAVSTVTTAKLLYTAKDFLKSKPYDFFPNTFKPDLEEFADFAVFEVTFADAQEAKRTTQDYYNESVKFKFRNESYLTKPPTLWKDPIFYSAGFPNGGYSSYPMVATNKNPNENGQLYPSLSDEIKKQGSPFANVRILSSFTNHEGINDALLGMSNLTLKYWGKELVQAGLIYAIRHDAMRGGSSGSMVINDQNQIIGIHNADWDKSDVGLSIALKSERFLYNNIPNYYLPEYDLIYGGGKDQKNSYYQALMKAYQNQGEIQTYLFPNTKTNSK